mmetsp:Transcript_104462/g.213066  ORF Transcript_104462/g.213066 Transcript_104462/m.213066 type:complete len:106 (+) Transcript_104462:109-426(+)
MHWLCVPVAFFAGLVSEKRPSPPTGADGATGKVSGLVLVHIYTQDIERIPFPWCRWEPKQHKRQQPQRQRQQGCWMASNPMAWSVVVGQDAAENACNQRQEPEKK